jgi:hypothetical protein
LSTTLEPPTVKVDFLKQNPNPNRFGTEPKAWRFKSKTKSLIVSKWRQRPEILNKPKSLTF